MEDQDSRSFEGMGEFSRRGQQSRPRGRPGPTNRDVTDLDLLEARSDELPPSRVDGMEGYGASQRPTITTQGDRGSTVVRVGDSFTKVRKSLAGRTEGDLRRMI